MKIESAPPFEDYVVYKSWRRKLARYLVTMVHRETKVHRIMSFARYTLAVKLGRELTEAEEADHKDGDKANDVPTNLQSLDRLANQRKAVIESGRSEVQHILTCPQCGGPFTRPTNYVNQRERDGRQMFCSRQCSGANSTRKRLWRPVV